MALNQKQLQDLLSSIQKTGTNAVPNLASAAVDTKQNTIDSLTKQIQNTSAKLSAVGENPEQVTDTRNIVEKALNLTPDQSFIFDIFELINRPQQALFGAIEEGASGGSALEGALGGLTGNKDTQFKDVLKTVTGSELGDVKGQLDLIDVVGFTGDVFLDPADLGMLVVTGGTSFAGQVAMNAQDLGKATNAAFDLTQIGKKITDIVPTNVSKFGDLTTGAKVAETAQDILFGQGKRIAKLSPEQYIGAILNKSNPINQTTEVLSLTGLTMRTIGGSAKAMTKLTDGILTSGFKMLDSSGNLSKSYDGLKEFGKYAGSSAGREIKHAVNIATERFNLGISRLKGVDDNLVDSLKKIADKREARIAEIMQNGLPNGTKVANIQEATDYVRGEYYKDVMDLFEHQYSSNLLNPDRFVTFLEAQPYIPYKAETLEDLKAIFGADLIEGNYVRKTYEGIDAIVFNEDLFKKGSNYPDLLRAAAKKAKQMDIFDAKTLGDYEKTLRLSNRDSYDAYISLKKKYNDDLTKRVNDQFFKEKRKVFKGGNQQSSWNKMKAKIEAGDIAVGKHPQNYLTSGNFIESRYNVWLTDDERLLAKSLMSKEEVTKFNADYKKAKELAGDDLTKLDEVEKEFDSILRNYEGGDVGVHYGTIVDGYKAESMAKQNFGRDTGHFGTGTYLLSPDTNPTKMFSENRTKNVIKMSDYNLYKPLNYREGMRTHDLLKEVDDLTILASDNYSNIINDPAFENSIKLFLENNNVKFYADNLESLVSDAQFGYIDELLGSTGVKAQDLLDSLPDAVKQELMAGVPGNAVEAFTESLKRFDKIFNNIVSGSDIGITKDNTQELISSLISSLKDASKVEWYSRTNMDSLATVLMKRLGFEGVDVRAIPELNNTRYGSVIYDLKNPVVGENTNLTNALKNYKNAGRIRMGQWQNDAIKTRLDNLAQAKDVQEGVEVFKKSFQDAQRAVGLSEFGDEDALLRMSFEGYATHGLSKDVQNILEDLKKSDKALKNAVEYEVFAPGRTRALKGREYYGSAYGINEFRKAFYKDMFKEGADDWLTKQFPKVAQKDYPELEKFLTETDLFSRSATESMFNFMDNSYDALNKNHKISDALLAMSTGNPGKPGAAFQNLSADSAVPTGYTKMVKSEVQKTIATLEANMKYQGESKLARDLISELSKSLRTDRMPVMESHIFEMVKLGNAATPKKALGLLDVINNGFKIGKTTSIGFNVKNFTGNMMNQWLAGVPVKDIPAYWNKANDMRKTMKRIEADIVEKGFEGLDDAEKAIFNTYQEFLNAGFMSRSSVYSLQGLDSTVRWKDTAVNEKTFSSLMDNPVTRANMNANLLVDNVARLSLYLYAKENPSFITKLGLNAGQADSAMKAVRLVHFDPHDLTFFEDDVMKRLVPFYTFTRQNMAFQLKNVVRHSEKYRRLFKAFDQWNEQFAGLSPEDLQQYQRDQLYMPVWKKKDGQLVMAKLSLPVTALSELQFGAEDLTQNVVSKLTPLIRAPFEAATGTQTFTGQPIERYEGELSTRIALPGVTKGTEWLMSQVGLDTPLSAVTQLGQSAYQAATGQDGLRSGLKATGVFDIVNPQDNQLSKLYSTIESLNARSKVLQSQGVEIPTLDAINAVSGNDKLNTQLTQLQNINDIINNIKR